MLLAEVEFRHSRPVSPTRRVAIGFRMLPIDGPGWGAVLLGAVVSHGVAAIDPETLPEVHDLVDDLEAGRKISQPRLRHRFQKDTVGLDRSRHSLIGEGENVWFDLDGHASPEVNLLGALYAAAELPDPGRAPAFRTLRRAMRWVRPTDAYFVAHLFGRDELSKTAVAHDRMWALVTLGFEPYETPDRSEVLARFREAVWAAHPDRGGDVDDAGERITNVTEARRILVP